MHQHIYTVGIVIFLSTAVASCAPRTQANNDALTTKLSSELSSAVPMDTYANCAAVFGVSYNDAKSRGDEKTANETIFLSTIYMKKAVALSSIEVAVAKMAEYTKQYSQMRQQNAAAFYQTSTPIIQSCNALVPPQK